MTFEDFFAYFTLVVLLAVLIWSSWARVCVNLALARLYDAKALSVKEKQAP